MNLFERESDGRLIFSADGKQSEQQNSETAECLKSSSSRDSQAVNIPFKIFSKANE